MFYTVRQQLIMGDRATDAKNAGSPGVQVFNASPGGSLPYGKP